MSRPRPVAVGPSLLLGSVLLVASAVAVGFGGAPASGASGSAPSSAPSSTVPAGSEVAGATSPAAAEKVLAGRPGAPRSSAPAARPTAPTTTALVDDHCVDRDLPAPPATDVVLTLLDRTYALPADYVPPDLVPAAEAGFTGASGDRLIRAAVVPDLAAMRAAMAAEGLTITLDSAYRAYWTQVATFDSWVARLGEAEAIARSARPGHSEHQLGTTIDVTSPGWAGRFGDWAVESAEGAWLARHAWEYGFVMSYPMGSDADTCFSYEPWHYRWIGREAAADQQESGLHLRQFLERFVGDG